MKKTETTPVKETTASPPKVEISLVDAIKMYSMYSSIKNAEGHFQSCQSTNFREHVKSVINAQNVVMAFERLNAEIEAHKAEK